MLAMLLFVEYFGSEQRVVFLLLSVNVLIVQ